MTEAVTDPTGFCLPDLGEGLTDAEIVSWLVSPGDRVVASQPLVTVETDKAVVDIPSPRSGVIADCVAAVGDVVEVGAPLVRFAAEGTRRDAGAVVGDLPAAAPTAAAPSPGRASAVAQAQRRASATGGSPRASPRARRRAQELGVDLSAVAATGPEGVIGLRDVEGAGPGGERLIGVRRAMARRMTDASARVARATVTGEADISAWADGGGASPMVRLIRAVGAAATSEPRLNAAYDDAREVLRSNRVVDLGIAMESPDGLFVPVVRNVTAKAADGIAAELEHLEQAVADRTIRPDDLRGQTLTLSNFGAVGGRHAEMVVVPPQVAVVGAGRAFECLVPAEQGTAVGRMLPLSVSFDHRVVTGVEACRFLNAMIADLEQSA